jgi:hypothetical protein
MEQDTENVPRVFDTYPETTGQDTQLPADFDTTCKCGKELERVESKYLTRRRPFAVFVCKSPTCDCRLYLFEAPRIPLILAHSDFPKSFAESACFSEFIDRKIKEREEKHARNELRARRLQATEP